MARKPKKTGNKSQASVAIPADDGATAIQSTESTTDEKARRPRHTADWGAKPYAVIVGKSLVCKAQFATLGEAGQFISDLPPNQRERAFVGRFSPIEVQTNVNLPKL